MQSAWLLGALVVPQLLGLSPGTQGAEREWEWEGDWGGAQEEEREREALMLKVSWEVLGLSGECWDSGKLWAWEEVFQCWGNGQRGVMG